MGRVLGTMANGVEKSTDTTCPKCLGAIRLHYIMLTEEIAGSNQIQCPVQGCSYVLRTKSHLVRITRAEIIKSSQTPDSRPSDEHRFSGPVDSGVVGAPVETSSDFAIPVQPPDPPPREADPAASRLLRTKPAADDPLRPLKERLDGLDANLKATETRLADQRRDVGSKFATLVEEFENRRASDAAKFESDLAASTARVDALAARLEMLERAPEPVPPSPTRIEAMEKVIARLPDLLEYVDRRLVAFENDQGLREWQRQAREPICRVLSELAALVEQWRDDVGVERFPEPGAMPLEFDSARHVVVETRPDPRAADAARFVEVRVNGYQFQGEVVRKAQLVRGIPPAPAAAPLESPTES